MLCVTQSLSTCCPELVLDVSVKACMSRPSACHHPLWWQRQFKPVKRHTSRLEQTFLHKHKSRGLRTLDGRSLVRNCNSRGLSTEGSGPGQVFAEQVCGSQPAALTGQIPAVSLLCLLNNGCQFLVLTFPIFACGHISCSPPPFAKGGV